MYLRYTTVRKNGKVHKYWRLVRSVRLGSKVRQQTVAQLGELDAEGRVSARELAKSFAGVDRQRRLFEEDTISAPVHVNVSNLRLERNRRFGDVWMAWKLWQALGLDEWLAVRMPRGRAAVPWDVIAAVLVIARFCAPSRELQIAVDWYRRTALDDLLGLPEEKVKDDRLYRALDRLLPYKDELAARGYLRDHRPDCKQDCIGLVVTREGYPLGYEIFPGNKHDSSTLQEIVKRMEQRYGSAERIWVVDCGMVSEANRKWLQELKSRYIVGTPKCQLKRFDAQLLSGKWSQVREGLDVQLVPTESGAETFIVFCPKRQLRQQFPVSVLPRFVIRIAGSEQLRLSRPQQELRCLLRTRFLRRNDVEGQADMHFVRGGAQGLPPWAERSRSFRFGFQRESVLASEGLAGGQ